MNTQTSFFFFNYISLMRRPRGDFFFFDWEAIYVYFFSPIKVSEMKNQLKHKHTNKCEMNIKIGSITPLFFFVLFLT